MSTNKKEKKGTKLSLFATQDLAGLNARMLASMGMNESPAVKYAREMHKKTDMLTSFAREAEKVNRLYGMDRLADAASSLAQQSKSMLHSALNVHKAADILSYLEQERSMIERVREIYEPTSSMISTLAQEASALESIRNIYEPVDILSSLAKEAEKFNAIYDKGRMKDIASSFLNESSILETALELQKKVGIDFKGIFENFQSYASLFNQVDFDRLQLATGGLVTYDGDIVDVGEADSIVAEIVATPGVEVDFNQFIDLLVKRIQAQKGSLKAYLTQILRDIVGGLIVAFMLLYMPPFSKQSQSISQEVVREVKKEFSAIVSQREIRNLHFVKKNFLHVYAGPEKQSERTDIIYFAKSVQVVGRKKTWRLIEYYDEVTGEIREGWVHGRYLEKVRK
jgi:hypothetical protein